MSVGIYHRRGAAELKARSPTRRRDCILSYASHAIAKYICFSCVVNLHYAAAVVVEIKTYDALANLAGAYAF